MEAPNPLTKDADVEPKQSHTQASTLPIMQPANVASNVEDEEDELADDDDVVMMDIAAGSSTVPSQHHPQSTPANLPRSARGDEETATAASAPASVPNPTQNAPAPSTSTKKSHKPRAPKPEKSMMTSFKVRPPKEGAVNPVISTAASSVPSGPTQLNVPAPVPTTEAAASKTSKATPIPKGQMKKRSKREEPNDPNVQVFYHDDAAAPGAVPPKNEYPPEAAPSLVPPAPSKPRASSKQRTAQAEQPTEFFSIPVADPLDLNGNPPKQWNTSYRTIQTISGATFGTRVWKSTGVKAEPLKPPPNWVLAPIYPVTSSATAQAGSGADKAAGGGGTGTGTPTGAPTKRGRKSKAELAVLAAATADGTVTPGKKSKAPKKPKKEKVGKSALVVDEPESGAVTPSVQPEDVEMTPAS